MFYNFNILLHTQIINDSLTVIALHLNIYNDLCASILKIEQILMPYIHSNVR